MLRRATGGASRLSHVIYRCRYCRAHHLNGERALTNVDEQLDIVRDAYEVAGHADNLAHEVCPGGHHLGIAHLAEDVDWLMK